MNGLNSSCRGKGDLPKHESLGGWESHKPTWSLRPSLSLPPASFETKPKWISHNFTLKDLWIMSYDFSFLHFWDQSHTFRFCKETFRGTSALPAAQSPGSPSRRTPPASPERCRSGEGRRGRPGVLFLDPSRAGNRTSHAPFNSHKKKEG